MNVLDPEIIRIIAEFLRIKDQYNLCLTSRRMRNIICKNTKYCSLCESIKSGLVRFEFHGYYVYDISGHTRLWRIGEYDNRCKEIFGTFGGIEFSLALMESVSGLQLTCIIITGFEPCTREEWWACNDSYMNIYDIFGKSRSDKYFYPYKISSVRTGIRRDNPAVARYDKVLYQCAKKTINAYLRLLHF